MNANIARHLSGMAAAQPGAPAPRVPRGRTASGAIDCLSLSCAGLLAETDAWCHRLRSRGLPVDIRHNARIRRLALARWAASARAYRAVWLDTQA